MAFRLPQYTRKDYLVLAFVILPFAMVMNLVVLGSKYYASVGGFLLATVLTGLLLSADFVLCGWVAVMLRHRFPRHDHTPLRLALAIVIFILFDGLWLLVVFHGYELIHFKGYRFNEEGFIWSYVSLSIISIFLTVLMEGISRFEQWKENQRVNGALQLSYRHGQVEALKSQVNPHFLFNSLNTLSSLITVDEKQAEHFLNEMSKVYRYMLRNDDEKLVSLRTEIDFLGSYLYLLQTRYSEAINVNISISEDLHERLLPPLTLQVIIESAFTQNVMSKQQPLAISLSGSSVLQELVITHNLQPKRLTGMNNDIEYGLDNLVEKYQLLQQRPVQIRDTQQERKIVLPLLEPQTEVL